ncbi:MAG: 50S ribosomal protein L7/L12 [Planctomycetes bacterium]|nr:50S ribosomal protein L7/L12 [Planctomycetota bacterium]
MAEAPAKEFSATTTEMADKLVQLTVKEAQELVDCLKEVHGIEPAGGGVVMAAGGGGEAAVEEEQTSFDAILTSFGDKKIQVIKVVRALTSLGLKEAKELVESAPKAIKEDVSKEDAEKIKADVEEVGGAVSIQ